METFSALLAICAGEFTGPRWIPRTKPVTRSFDVFFDLRLNKQWENNREAGDLRRHCAHYDVIVMKWLQIIWRSFEDPGLVDEIFQDWLSSA